MTVGTKTISTSPSGNLPNLQKGKASIWTWTLDKCLKIGYQEDLSQLDKNRVIIANAISFLMLAVGGGFMLGLYIAGSQSWYFVGLALPIYSSVLIANSRRKHKFAQYMLYFASLSLLTLLCFTNRKVGAEYGLIAVACSVPLMSKKKSEIYQLFTLSAMAYIAYKVYDYFHPFTHDPSINYPVVSTIALLISTTAIFIQSFLFRNMVKKYSHSLKRRNQELTATIEDKEAVEVTLEKKNRELNELTDQLNWIVKQKTLELQTYIDAINVNICSTIIDLDGDFIKVNEPFLKLSGYSEEELIGKNIRMLDTDDQKSFFLDIQTCFQSGKTWRGEVKNIGKEGAVFWTDQMVIPMKIRGNHISYFLMLAFPITQRKLHEESRENTRLLLENIAYQTSHKIRGPLARIQGLMDLVQKGFVDTNEIKDVTNGLITCSAELNLATSDLVQFVAENQVSMEADKHEPDDIVTKRSKTLLQAVNAI